ncbi:ABC transporter permease [Marinisporobacter balticus]|uniref:Sulfonate transport system permease protein n=1 Tax=Marinisporobacter balticus TaxID=2018667 RepID=A0A4V2SC04_9FIRM|nr:ABC transporter permease [Marinisporobacter balticus]TCO77490.1 sulfonate transport system permease protein [Marinisporobacter balticus]
MKKVKGFIVPAIIFCIWWRGSELGLWNAYIIPHPMKVVNAFVILFKKGILFKHVTVSLYRALLGFTISFIFAFLLAISLSFSKNLLELLERILDFMRHIPPMALIPVLILWFGIGEMSKLAVIILATFFPIFLNTLSGIMCCDQKLIEVGKVFGFSKFHIYIKIIFPQAIPSIMVGARLGFGYSWRALIGAEIIAASSGLGYMILDAEQLSRPDIIIVGIFTIGILGSTMDYILFKCTNWFLHWEKQEQRGGENWLS